MSNGQSVLSALDLNDQIASGFEKLQIVGADARSELHGIGISACGVVIEDRVLAVADTEKETVITGAAVQVVVADIADKLIVARAAVEFIIAGPAKEHIVAAGATASVVTRAIVKAFDPLGDLESPLLLAVVVSDFEEGCGGVLFNVADVRVSPSDAAQKVAGEVCRVFRVSDGGTGNDQRRQPIIALPALLALIVVEGDEMINVFQMGLGHQLIEDGVLQLLVALGQQVRMVGAYDCGEISPTPESFQNRQFLPADNLQVVGAIVLSGRFLTAGPLKQDLRQQGVASVRIRLGGELLHQRFQLSGGVQGHGFMQ